MHKEKYLIILLKMHACKVIWDCVCLSIFPENHSGHRVETSAQGGVGRCTRGGWLQPSTARQGCTKAHIRDVVNVAVEVRRFPFVLLTNDRKQQSSLSSFTCSQITHGLIPTLRRLRIAFRVRPRMQAVALSYTRLAILLKPLDCQHSKSV